MVAAFLLVDRERCSTQFINDGGFVRGQTRTRAEYERMAEERVNVEQLMVLDEGSSGLEIAGSAFVLTRAVQRGEEAFTWYGPEYWAEELGLTGSLLIRLPGSGSKSLPRT